MKQLLSCGSVSVKARLEEKGQEVREGQWKGLKEQLDKESGARGWSPALVSRLDAFLKDADEVPK